MKPLRLFLFLFLLLPPVTRAAEIAWQTDYEAALANAAEAGKPLLLDFSASWCGPCKMMEAQTFTNAAVQEALAAYVAVRIDFDKNPGLVGKYHVSGIPHLVILNRFGETVASSTGFQDAARMSAWLASNRAAAFAATSRLQAANAMIVSIEKELHSPDPALRSRGVETLLDHYLSKDEFSKTAAKMLQGMVDRQPTEMLPRLNDSHLALRILFANQFAEKLGPAFAFDPWAPAEARAAAVQALTTPESPAQDGQK